MKKEKKDSEYEVYANFYGGSVFGKAVNLLQGSGEFRHYGVYVDREGCPVERTPHSHPYSYDSFVVWKKRANSGPTGNGSIYSDRLLQWDYAKHNTLTKKHFGNKGQSWRDRKPAKVEAFLRDWCEDPQLELLEIVESCNVSNGYPCWCFIFSHQENRDKQ